MTNRLADSQSLYLRKHAENPIDWWPWIPAALAAARGSDRPIFLSIGYSSCHWCTVMEGEAFSDAAIADYMNAHFIPIKVDREERPDLDNIYMQALQVMAGQGGWPLNVFLDPHSLIPFYGGTYFPVQPRYGRPGFLQLLQAIRDYYDTKKEQLSQQQEKLQEILAATLQLGDGGKIDPDFLPQGLAAAVPVVSRMSVGQQFPMIPYAQLTLQAARWPDRETDARKRATERGMDLVLGGIFDHVGGGFHRYTVDPTWTVPHFEKMLYDNGQILEFLANLWAEGIQDAAVERAVRLTVQWLEREMTAPQGYFYAAQDADSFATPEEAEPEEGDFYVWRLEELKDSLSSEELAALDGAFFLSEAGNFGDRPGYNVLQRIQEGALDPVAEQALANLFAIRYGQLPSDTPFPPARDAAEAKSKDWLGRIPPVTDTKMIVAWNSLTISGLARAATVFQQPHYLDLAVRAATVILQAQRSPEGHLLRVNYDGSPAIAAKSEDYALLVKALLDVQQATLLQSPPESQAWLTAAIALQSEMDERLWDTEGGGYFVTATEDATEFILREKDYQDNATPSANGMAIANLVRLSALTGNLAYLDRAERGLNALSSILQKYPRACPSLLSGLDAFYNSVQVKVHSEVLASLLTGFWPTATFSVESLADTLGVGLVCLGMECLEPATTAEQLLQQLRQAQCRV
jgi:uncharacterized protein YyaL (SSP411 family)